MTRVVRLTEYRRSEPVELTPHERDALRVAVTDLVVQPAFGSERSYVLTPGSTVGVVRIDDLVVHIQPKVGAAPVLFMLSYAFDPRAWRPDSAPICADADLAEAIVPMFCRLAEEALRPGLLHGYVRVDESGPTIRGRVRFADQARRHRGAPLPVEISYDDYTPDILENRLLVTALTILGRLRLRHAESNRVIARLSYLLQGVSLLPAGRRPQEPIWTRLNARYRPAIGLARLIIEGLGVEAAAGGVEANSLLVNMNAVFESFVRVALMEALGLDAAHFPVGSGVSRTTLDKELLVRLQPDLSWWQEGRCVFVGDCKYKKSWNGVPNADVYQLLAYLTAFELDDGMLIYAAGEDTERSVSVRHTGKRIRVHVLDVTRPPRDVLQDVARLSEEIRTLAWPPIVAREATLAMSNTVSVSVGGQS